MLRKLSMTAGWAYTNKLVSLKPFDSNADY